MRLPILILRGRGDPSAIGKGGGGRMVIRGYDISNNDGNRSSLGDNRWGEEGRVRKVKDAYVEDIDIKADGEGLAVT